LLPEPGVLSGKRKDLRKFLQEVKIYLLANGDVYPTDLDKVLFVISYMNEGTTIPRTLQVEKKNSSTQHNRRRHKH
jgi:hypothetical protein